MFERNEYVFHESGGICRIIDIQTAPLEGMPADRLYYIMKPIHDANSVIYLPVDCDSIFVRRLLCRAEAEELLDRIPFVLAIEENNAKLLRAKYTEAMNTHDPLDWIRVIKTAYLRAEAQSFRTQRLSETERSFAEHAKRNLHSELAIALGLEERDMEEYIINHVKNMA